MFHDEAGKARGWTSVLILTHQYDFFHYFSARETLIHLFDPLGVEFHAWKFLNNRSILKAQIQG